MLPSELVILMAISINKRTGQKLLTNPLDVTSEYMSYLFNSLVNRGYLKGHRTTGFRLTTIGRDAVQTFIRKKGSKQMDIVERLRTVGINISPEQERKIFEVEKEGIKRE